MLAGGRRGHGRGASGPRRPAGAYTAPLSMTPYLVATLIVAFSVLIGAAVCRACGAGAVLVPATGLSTLMAVVWVGVHLPGDGATAAVLATLLAGGAAWWLLRRAGMGPIDPAAVLAGAGTGGFLSLQFL